MREVALQNSFACHREIAGFGVDFFLGAIARDLLYSVFYFFKKVFIFKEKKEAKLLDSCKVGPAIVAFFVFCLSASCDYHPIDCLCVILAFLQDWGITTCIGSCLVDTRHSQLRKLL